MSWDGGKVSAQARGGAEPVQELADRRELLGVGVAEDNHVVGEQGDATRANEGQSPGAAKPP